MISLKFNKNYYYDAVLNDGLEFRKRSGVTSMLTEATRMEYERISDLIQEAEYSEGECLNISAMQEIQENKWFIHMYDIEGTLN